MRLTRHLREEQIDLEFAPELPAPPDDESDDGPHPERHRWAVKEAVLAALVEILDRSEQLSNKRKVLTDLQNRERKATTGLGRGVALPHVRTPSARGFAIAIARAPEPGLDWDAVDGEPVRLFIAMVAPNHDDKFYLKVERDLALAIEEDEGLLGELLGAAEPGEVIRLLQKAVRS